MEGHASLKAGMSRFHVAVAMIQANDNGLFRVVEISNHKGFLLFLFVEFVCVWFGCV